MIIPPQQRLINLKTITIAEQQQIEGAEKFYRTMSKSKYCSTSALLAQEEEIRKAHHEFVCHMAEIAHINREIKS
jgi:hypothetical protein